jgi:dTMP kinase
VQDLFSGADLPYLIALEGLDACGKGTQAQLLADTLDASLFKYPAYETETGQAIKRAFANPHPDPQLAAYSLQALQTVNRLETSEFLWKLLSYGSVVLDRYTASAYAYGVADGLSMDWLRGIEPSSLPQPSLQIYIDISVEESFRRRPERDDRYEADRVRMQRVRQAYVDLFDNPPRALQFNRPDEPTAWLIVDGHGTIDEVHQRILACLP